MNEEELIKKYDIKIELLHELESMLVKDKIELVYKLLIVQKEIDMYSNKLIKKGVLMKNQFTIVGHLVEEPIENLETGEVELKINIKTKEGYGNVIVTAKNDEVINYAKGGRKDNLVGVTVYLADKNRLVAERIEILANKENK